MRTPRRIYAHAITHYKNRRNEYRRYHILEPIGKRVPTNEVYSIQTEIQEIIFCCGR
jgi:tRNA G37 N-methylase TrmD